MPAIQAITNGLKALKPSSMILKSGLPKITIVRVYTDEAETGTNLLEKWRRVIRKTKVLLY